MAITNQGRESLVLMAADEYRRLKSRDREALLATELDEARIQAIATAELPAEAYEFDHELKS